MTGAYKPWLLPMIFLGLMVYIYGIMKVIEVWF